MTKKFVNKLTTEDIEKNRAFFSQYAFKPYFYYTKIDRKYLDHYFVNHLLSLMKNKENEAYGFFANGELKGVTVIGMQPWDSDQLGIKVGTIYYLIVPNEEKSLDIKGQLISEIIDRMKDRGVIYLNLRVESRDFAAIHFLEKSGFQMIDGIITFSLDLRKELKQEETGPFLVRLAKEEDIEILKDIAASSFIYDRFHNDPFLSNKKCDELHASWIENSVKGRVEAVLVAEGNDVIQGFLTCRVDFFSLDRLKLKVGRIELVASSKKIRKKGIGKSLTIEALKWFKRAGVDIVEVGTQINNVPASRLYQTGGFKLANATISFRKILREI